MKHCGTFDLYDFMKLGSTFSSLEAFYLEQIVVCFVSNGSTTIKSNMAVVVSISSTATGRLL